MVCFAMSVFYSDVMTDGEPVEWDIIESDPVTPCFHSSNSMDLGDGIWGQSDSQEQI